MTIGTDPERLEGNMDDSDHTITRGSDNVLLDLGFADAAEMDAKLRLVIAINATIASRRLTQSAAAALLGVSQPKVSALKNHKIDGFSIERLMGFLVTLGKDVDIIIRDRTRARSSARISVVAA